MSGGGIVDCVRYINYARENENDVPRNSNNAFSLAMCVDSLFDSEERGKSEAVDRARRRFVEKHSNFKAKLPYN